MERSEPALVPEWLKTSGSTGSSNQFAPSLLHSDDHVVSKHERNKPSPSISDRDIRLSSSFSSQTTSPYLHQSSSSSQLRTHNSFGRVQQDQRYNDYLDPLILRRSRSSLTGSGRRGESYKNGNKSNPSNGDSLLSGVSVRNVHKSAFERDFPSLGAEERKAGSELGRVSSPGLSTVIGSSALIGSDGWTSALVEVHGSNGMTVTAPQQAVSGSSPSMAETVAQSPSHAGATPLLSVKTLRLEELVMKQSKQLVPMTPSLAKTQHASHSANLNLTLRGVPAKSEVLKTSMGKLQVLKPSQDLNGTASTAKESSSPTNGSRVLNSTMGSPSLASGSVPFRRLQNNPNLTESKPTPKTAEKKPSSQTKSRNDFFNLIKKKSSAPSPSTTIPCSSPVVSPSALELEKLNGDAPSSDTSISDSSNGLKNSSIVTILPPDEEEAAFLHSLGWEEGSGEDEGLTEEEINGFYELYPSFRPPVKLHGVASNALDRLNSQNGSFHSTPSRS